MDICIVTPMKELERVCLLAKVLADRKEAVSFFVCPAPDLPRSKAADDRCAQMGWNGSYACPTPRSPSSRCGIQNCGSRAT